MFQNNLKSFSSVHYVAKRNFIYQKKYFEKIQDIFDIFQLL
jgi:hypothetical protein